MSGSVGQQMQSRPVSYVRGLLALAVMLTTTVVAPVAGTHTAAAAVSTSAYVPMTPYRLADTRMADCGCARLDPATIAVPVTGRPGVPAGAIAVSVTVTAPATTSAGFVALYPGGTSRPLVSVLNTRRDRPVANSAIIQLGASGTIELYENVPGDVVVDITGAFVSAASSRAGRYVPVAPRRLVDTRDPGPFAGVLGPGGELTIPLPAGVPADASALAINVTSVGDTVSGFLSARPAGTPFQVTSFLNTNGSGQAVAATTIAPVTASGITLYSHGGGHVVVDFLGWFTGASASDASDGLFVPIGPQRVLDTRESPPRTWPGGTVGVPNSFPGAAALVTNVTATRSDRAGFVTAYAAGTPRPDTSTLNPAMFEHTLANLAITRLSDMGLAYYSHAGNDVVVDVTGMFTGTPVAATEVTVPAHPAFSRVLLVGDSTLAAVSLLYPQSQSAFIGFEGIVDAASCRRLSRPSCKSAVTLAVPNTAVEAILGTPGTIDVLVVKTGYNDWNSNFPAEFDAVVRAGRAKGAHTILWLSYTESQTSPKSREAYQENNADLYQLVTLPQYSDVVLADWRAYTAGIDYWTWDGSHLTEAGSWLQTDFVSRWIAAIEHRPCPAPWGPGGPAYDPCPPPESIGPVPSARSLY